MPKKTRKIGKKQGPACANHPNNHNTEECERCKKFFCSDCIVEDWHENFFSQFIGQKRKYIQKIYCKPCEKRVVRIRLLANFGLLILFGLPIVLWLLISL
ncbi:MAG: hypothetical protein ACXACP_01285 [Candidatus Hodarchaeales archaeon]|jgi:hypothetical protein